MIRVAEFGHFAANSRARRAVIRAESRTRSRRNARRGWSRTRCASGRCTRAGPDRCDKRLSGRISGRDGCGRVGRAGRRRRFSMTSYSKYWRSRDSGSRLGAGRLPVVAFDQGVAAVGEPVELEVVVGRGVLVEPFEYGVEGFRALPWRASTKLGTQRRVTVSMMPRAPRPTRAALKSSGRWVAEQVTTEPSASIRSRASIWVAMPPSLAPVPWVPVEIAPAIVCASMSPRLAMARPSACRPALSRVDRGAGADGDQAGARVGGTIPDQLARSTAIASATAMRGEGVAAADGANGVAVAFSAVRQLRRRSGRDVRAVPVQRVGRAVPAQFRHGGGRAVRSSATSVRTRDVPTN